MTSPAEEFEELRAALDRINTAREHLVIATGQLDRSRNTLLLITSESSNSYAGAIHHGIGAALAAVEKCTALLNLSEEQIQEYVIVLTGTRYETGSPAGQTGTMGFTEVHDRQG